MDEHEYEYQELCPHGRHIGAVCVPCEEEAEKRAHDMWEKLHPDGIPMPGPQLSPTKSSGLDAPYYDFPKSITCAQDMIEWLGLDFANGNVLKSLVREYGTTKKKTSALYEAEKRYFFAKRHLRNVQKKRAGGDGLSGDVEKGLEETQEKG